MRACKHKCTSTPKNQANANPTGYYILDLSTSLPGPSSPTLLASLSLSFPLSPSIAPSRSRSRAPTLSPYNYHYDYNVLGLAGPKDGDGDWSRGQADSDANDAARRVLRIDGLHYLCVRASSCYCLCVRARASLLSKYLQEDICEKFTRLLEHYEGNRAETICESEVSKTRTWNFLNASAMGRPESDEELFGVQNRISRISRYDATRCHFSPPTSGPQKPLPCPPADHHPFPPAPLVEQIF